MANTKASKKSKVSRKHNKHPKLIERFYSRGKRRPEVEVRRSGIAKPDNVLQRYNRYNIVKPYNIEQEENESVYKIVLSWNSDKKAQRTIEMIESAMKKKEFSTRIDRFNTTRITKLTITASSGDPLRELIEEILKPNDTGC